MKTAKPALVIKKSRLKNAGKGLFTKSFIPKGSRIVEYLGKLSSWKDVDHRGGKNVYIYYINRNHVIDAYTYKKAFARYANDAGGISKVKGIRNNARYEKDGLKVYITAARDIQPGEEIYVTYGKEYWDAIKFNMNL